MLENNSSRLIFAAIAVVIGGVIYGSVNAAYPDATNQIIKKIQAPFDDSNNSDSNVNVAQYAQKTINVYVPYAIVPGKGILTSRHDRTSFGDDYNHGYSMKDSSFIKDKYNVHDDNGGMYSDYSLDNTFYDQADIAPLLQNGNLSNIKIPNTPDTEAGIFVANVSNKTSRQGSLDLDQSIFSNGGDGSSYDENNYTISQNGTVEKTSDFIKNNSLTGPFISWQVPAGAILDGWSQDDYNNTTQPKDSSIDGFYTLKTNTSASELASLVDKNNLSSDATLQYIGKIHINFHFVDVGYDTTSN